MLGLGDCPTLADPHQADLIEFGQGLKWLAKEADSTLSELMTLLRLTQGSAFRATLGWMTQSFQDCLARSFGFQP